MRKGKPHRCRRCRARRTWSRQRKTEPKCDSCGARDWVVDAHREHRRDHRRQTCKDPQCYYMHPHSRYSPLCWNNPRGIDEDLLGELYGY